MALLSIATALLLSSSTLGQQQPFPSLGCGQKPTGYTLGSKQKRTITTTGTKREYYIYLPTSYDETTPVLSTFYFHGQNGKASQGDIFQSLAEANGFALVTLQGVNDKVSKSCGTGWNTGSSVNMTLSEETCTSKADTQTCCYESCKALGKCTGDGKDAKCMWSTCLDDAAFAEDVLAELGGDLCFDLDAVFASGFSNGGILSHYLAAANPNQWKGVLPVCGSPLRGYLDVSFALKGTSFLQLNGRSDNVIPYEGGISQDGWFYESMDDVAFAWGEVNGCSEDSRTFVTPYDGGSINLVCLEHPNCLNDVRVVRCLFDGKHTVPSIYNALAYWFMSTTVNPAILNAVAATAVNNSML